MDTGSQLEWERHYLTTLGVANKRLYEFRIQTSEAAYKTAEVGSRSLLLACARVVVPYLLCIFK